MTQEYVNLITDLIILRDNHPQYAELVDRIFKAMKVNEQLIKAIEAGQGTGDEQYDKSN